MKLHIIFACFLIQFIKLSVQQDVAVCPIGYDHLGGICVLQSCPNTHVLVNGECQLKPTSPSIPTNPSCDDGFDFIGGICVQQSCPNNQILLNGICQSNTQIAIPPTSYCPHGYTLYQGMCYQNKETVPMPCPLSSCQINTCPTTCIPIIEITTTQIAIITPLPTTTTTTTTTTPPTTTTTTTEVPTTTTTTLPPEDIRGCPLDSVFIDGKCRLIYCPKGTVHKGRCLEPVCSHGLVWTGSTCAKPEVITTILEIENTIVTEFNQTGPVFHQPEVINNVVYHTENYEYSTEETAETTPCSDTDVITTEGPSLGETKNCCTIITPRICKRYKLKWICFNRQYRRCDDVCGNNTLIYLRIPKVIDQPPVLLMPPNPPLAACPDDNCTTKDLPDCSGCVRNDRKACSSYCYRYRCPQNTCRFIDQSEYCTSYPGSSGCSNADGCLDDWCLASS